MKSEIIERLGQTDILLPSLIQEGLHANDRVKARLSILQAAGCHARDPSAGSFNLTEECRAAGLDTMAMEALVLHTNPAAGDQITAPGLAGLGHAIWDDVAAMIQAVAAGDAPAGDASSRRLAALKAAASLGSSDTLDLSQVARLTGLADDGGDSLHRLVMDLHKALNRLSASQAEEVLAGAHVYGLLAEDRPAVEAFMRGVESTRKLKFDHPGLATNAARSGSRLTIQNDIGETDAHVVVITVEADAVTVTYTDVHLARAKFFSGLFRDFPVQWSGLDRNAAGGLGSGNLFYLITGRCPIDGDTSRDALLEALGAALVFLIDWNKARKVLRNWVSKSDALHILEWAARNKVGHRGFLELGGSDLVASAVHNVASSRIGFGEQLTSALGHEAAVDFLRTVLRSSTEALLEGNSVRLARDRIEADLVRRLQGVGAALLAIVVRQAGLAREIAVDIARFIAERQAQRPFDQAGLAAKARRIEEKADRIAIDARGEIARLDADQGIVQLVNRIEEAIDELEQAAFIASLAPPALTPELLSRLAELCAAAVAGTEAVATGVAAASLVPEGQRIDAEDAFAATGRLVAAEHAGDAAERAVTALILGGDFELKTALCVLDLARAIERATDRLAGFGHLLREHVLADLSR